MQFVHYQTLAQIEAELQAAGPGARAVIFAHQGDPAVGHFFNAVNQRGTVRFLNGQAGTAQNLTGFVDGEMSMLRTK